MAARAVDGDRGTMSCTLGLVHPWLSVDLGAQYDVGHVTVMNDLNAGAGNYRRTLFTEYVTVYRDSRPTFRFTLRSGTQCWQRSTNWDVLLT